MNCFGTRVLEKIFALGTIVVDVFDLLNNTAEDRLAFAFINLVVLVVAIASRWECRELIRQRDSSGVAVDVLVAAAQIVLGVLDRLSFLGPVDGAVVDVLLSSVRVLAAASAREPRLLGIGGVVAGFGQLVRC